jgi:hypothetical protein
MPESNSTAAGTALEQFLAAVAQFQSARGVMFDVLAQHPLVVLQYTSTFNDRFAEIQGGDLLRELHLLALEHSGTSRLKKRAKASLHHLRPLFFTSGSLRVVRPQRDPFPEPSP